MSAVRRNALALIASQGATWISAIALLVIAPSELGDADFGRLSFATVFVGFFELIALFGTSDYLTKHVARSPESVGRYVAGAVMLKLIASSALCGVALGIAALLRFDGQMLVLIAVFSGGMVLNALNNALMGGLQGLQLMVRPAFWGVVRIYASAALGLLALYQDRGVVAYAAAFNIVGVIPIIANSWQLRRELRGQRGLDRHVWRDVVVGGFPFFVLATLLAIYGTIDIPMIRAFSDAETVGWYALAYRWVSMPVFFAVAIATAFFPALAAEGVDISDAFRTIANRAVHFVTFVAVPAAIGITLIADDFIHLLYGPQYAPSVPLMQLLAVHIPVVALDVVLGTVAVSADRQRQWMIYAIVASVFNPLTNLVAIPWSDHWFDNAALGAAFTTVLTEMILLIGAYRLRPTGVFDRSTQAIVLRVVVAGASMVPAVLAVRSTPMIVQVATAVVAYALASIVLRTLPIDDLRGIVHLVRRRGDRSDETDLTA